MLLFSIPLENGWNDVPDNKVMLAIQGKTSSATNLPSLLPGNNICYDFPKKYNINYLQYLMREIVTFIRNNIQAVSKLLLR